MKWHGQMACHGHGSVTRSTQLKIIRIRADSEQRSERDWCDVMGYKGRACDMLAQPGRLRMLTIPSLYQEACWRPSLEGAPPELIFPQQTKRKRVPAVDEFDSFIKHLGYRGKRGKSAKQSIAVNTSLESDVQQPLIGLRKDELHLIVECPAPQEYMEQSCREVMVLAARAFAQRPWAKDSVRQYEW